MTRRKVIDVKVSTGISLFHLYSYVKMTDINAGSDFKGSFLIFFIKQ